LKLSD